ncbi:Uncharacterized protein TCM_018391 [Theobroma cacao]|uniref:Uncharacterized protein n=1 Tax=Theobroma cacao TaxID=3641 RepID=A0A061EG74_THECC|nr:Uncharacterized protein TCM_018391 [Theobroma cacao]
MCKMFGEKNQRKIFYSSTQVGEVLIRNNKIQNNPFPTHPNTQGHVSVDINVQEEVSPSSNQEEDTYAVVMVTFSIVSSLLKAPRIMRNIKKPKFHILKVRISNYVSWCLDVEMHIQGQGLANAIIIDEKENDKDKVNALIFIRRHLHESLKTQYLSV